MCQVMSFIISYPVYKYPDGAGDDKVLNSYIKARKFYFIVTHLPTSLLTLPSLMILLDMCCSIIGKIIYAEFCTRFNAHVHSDNHKHMTKYF